MTDGITDMYDEERLKQQLLHEQVGEDFGLSEEASEISIIVDPPIVKNEIQEVEIIPTFKSAAMLMKAEREAQIRAVERLLEYLKSTS